MNPFKNSVRALILLGLLAGCGTTRQTSSQLERVAKDWCLTVRASQVIPVYPLTEDVQVGDIYLVQTAYEDQIAVYKAKGFLPLENLVARLHPPGYKEFYTAGYGIDDRVPRGWQFPEPPGTAADFSTAPRAAFPSYGFSVSRSEGLNVAVPVQSVPIGLNLLDSASADGTVTIKDCFTYGRGINDLQPLAQRFAQDNADFVRQFAPTEGKQFFLRVVNRVYLTKRLDVSLFSNQSTGGSLSGGVPRPVDLLNIGNSGTNASAIFAEVNKVINKPTTQPISQPATGAGAHSPTTQPAAPAIGATVNVTMASSRSVSLTETFDRPLVIGYIAFDLPILNDGKLGAPVATFSKLEQIKVLQGNDDVQFENDANSARIRAWLDGKPEHRQQLNSFLVDRFKPSPPPRIPLVINGEQHAALRQEIVDRFDIP